MVDRAQSLGGDAGIGDILVKIRGRHYLIPAEAIGSPLEDGGTEILGMLEKEISALGTQSRMIGVDFAMELGESDEEHNAGAISARQSRQCVRQSRQCARQSRQCARQSRQCARSARAIRPQAD
jgi:hypothetical protein